MKQARQGPVRSINSPAGKPRLQVSSIDAGETSLKCVVPGLLSAGCSLLVLDLKSEWRAAERHVGGDLW